MKKYLLAMAVVSLLSVVANAETSSSTIQMLKERIQQERISIERERASTTLQIRQVRASSTSDIKNQREDIKNQIELVARERMNNQKNEVLREFENAMNSLNNLATRTDSRIAKLVAQGIDMSTSTSLLNTAKTNIATAQAEVNTLMNLVSQITSTTTPKVLKAQIKSENVKARTAIQLAKKSLSAAINAVARSQVMKRENNREGRDATSTATTTRN